MRGILFFFANYDHLACVLIPEGELWHQAGPDSRRSDNHYRFLRGEP